MHPPVETTGFPKVKRMSGNRRWAFLAVLSVAMGPLAACDESPTTGPVRPTAAPEGQTALLRTAFRGFTPRIIPIPDAVEYRPDGSVFLYRDGAVYKIESPEDGVVWHDMEGWEEVAEPPTYETATWNDFELCDQCELTATEIARFGDADGPGSIEGPTAQVTWSAQLGYVVAGSTFLQNFDDDGRFVRRIGREGDGPGEFSAVADAHVVGGRLVALDRAARSWAIFNLQGEFEEMRPYGHQAGSFVPVGGNRVVVVARHDSHEDFERSPEDFGFPLHLADIDSGVPALHFGRRYPWGYDWAYKPYSDQVIGSVVGRSGTVWWGAAGSPQVHEWSIEDELLRVIEGDLPWFTEVTQPVDRNREPPPTLLSSIALDNQGYFWMVTQTADPDWRVVRLESGPAGPQIPVGDEVDYLDTRLDIFDLEEQRHIGRYLWDSPLGKLINLGGEPSVGIVEHGEDSVRQVVIYGVGWGSRTPTGSSPHGTKPPTRH